MKFLTQWGGKSNSPWGELKIFDLGGANLPPGHTLNMGGKMTKISIGEGEIFFSLACIRSCPCIHSYIIKESSFSRNL